MLGTREETLLYPHLYWFFYLVNASILWKYKKQAHSQEFFRAGEVSENKSTLVNT